jgi:hypothetical protein
VHDLNLILEIPLKTVGQIFTLYKMISLPTWVFDNAFALYKLDYDYFGLAHSQRDYMLMTEADIQKCSAGSITICPANKAIFYIQTLTCESEVYFQKIVKDGIC